MGKVFWFLCLGLSLAAFCRASANPQSIALVQHAVDISNVRTGGAAPFKLHVQVRSNDHSAPSSEYLLVWVSPEQWREEISIGNARSIRIGGKYTVATISDSEEAQVIRLQLRSLDFPAYLYVNPNQSLGKVKNRVHDGVKLQCVSRSGKYSPESEVCFDTATGTLAAEELGADTVVFSDYFEFRGKQFPRRVIIFKGKDLSRSIEVQELSYLPMADSSLFQVDQHYTTTSGCEHPVVPTPLALPDPDYPIALRTAKPQVVKLSALINESGSVQDISVTRSAGALDAYAIGALRKWRFAPATCEAIAVPFIFSTDVNFQTH